MVKHIYVIGVKDWTQTFDFIEKTTAFEREGFLKFQSKNGK